MPTERHWLTMTGAHGETTEVELPARAPAYHSHGCPFPGCGLWAHPRESCSRPTVAFCPDHEDEGELK